MVYEYQCTSRKCRHITEIVRPVSERLDTAFCEKCTSEALKVISIPTRAWGLKAENENFPMVNPFLSKPGQPPVVFENATERKTYYKRNGLVDAVTPEADRPTMYTNDVSCDNYKDYDKFKDLTDPVVENPNYVRVPDTWENNPDE
jgi:hypothetical protein